MLKTNRDYRNVHTYMFYPMFTDSLKVIEYSMEVLLESLFNAVTILDQVNLNSKKGNALDQITRM